MSVKRTGNDLGGRAAIVGIGATEFSKDSGRSEMSLACEAVVAAKGGCSGRGREVLEGALLGFKGLGRPGAGLAVNYGGPLDRGKFFNRFHADLFAVSELLGGVDGPTVDPDLDLERKGIFRVLFEQPAEHFAFAKA